MADPVHFSLEDLDIDVPTHPELSNAWKTGKGSRKTISKDDQELVVGAYRDAMYNPVRTEARKKIVKVLAEEPNYGMYPVQLKKFADKRKNELEELASAAKARVGGAGRTKVERHAILDELDEEVIPSSQPEESDETTEEPANEPIMPASRLVANDSNSSWNFQSVINLDAAGYNRLSDERKNSLAKYIYDTGVKKQNWYEVILKYGRDKLAAEPDQKIPHYRPNLYAWINIPFEQRLWWRNVETPSGQTLAEKVEADSRGYLAPLEAKVRKTIILEEYPLDAHWELDDVLDLPLVAYQQFDQPRVEYLMNFLLKGATRGDAEIFWKNQINSGRIGDTIPPLVNWLGMSEGIEIRTWIEGQDIGVRLREQEVNWFSGLLKRDLKQEGGDKVLPAKMWDNVWNGTVTAINWLTKRTKSVPEKVPVPVPVPVSKQATERPNPESKYDDKEDLDDPLARLQMEQAALARATEAQSKSLEIQAEIIRANNIEARRVNGVHEEAIHKAKEGSSTGYVDRSLLSDLNAASYITPASAPPLLPSPNPIMYTNPSSDSRLSSFLDEYFSDFGPTVNTLPIPVAPANANTIWRRPAIVLALVGSVMG